MRFAKSFRHHKTCAAAPGSIPGCIQNKIRMRPCFTIAAHPCKLLWPTQPCWPWQGHDLAVPTLHLTVLITDRQFPAPFIASGLEDRPPIFGCHPRQKAVFTAPRNTFWIPGYAHALRLLRPGTATPPGNVHTQRAQSLLHAHQTGIFPVGHIIRLSADHCQIDRIVRRTQMLVISVYYRRPYFRSAFPSVQCYREPPLLPSYLCHRGCSCNTPTYCHW